MNYTNPNDPDYQDKPEDWLNSALIFTRALCLLLKESEGIIVELKGDAKFSFNENIKKVIVYHQNGMIHVIEHSEEGHEGQLVWMHSLN